MSFEIPVTSTHARHHSAIAAVDYFGGKFVMIARGDPDAGDPIDDVLLPAEDAGRLVFDVLSALAKLGDPVAREMLEAYCPKKSACTCDTATIMAKGCQCGGN